MTVTIRPAVEGDALVLAALALQVWLDTYALEGVREDYARYVLERFTPPHFARLIADPRRRCWVAERRGHTLGFVVLASDAPCPVVSAAATTEIETLYVSRHAQGQGVGTALLAAATSLAACAVWLSTWHRNAGALAFYAQRGWRDVGTTWFELDGVPHENRVLLHQPSAVEG